MPWTAADIEAIKQAILDRKGARTIQFADQTVSFESIDDMLKLLAVMQGELTSTRIGSRTRYATTRKGTH